MKFSNAMRIGLLGRSWSSGGGIRAAARLKSASVPIFPLGFGHCIRKLHICANGVARHYIRQFLGGGVRRLGGCVGVRYLYNLIWMVLKTFNYALCLYF